MENIKYHSAVVFVNDIATSKQFYTEVLHLKIEHDFGKNVIFYGGLSIWEISDSHVIAKNLRTCDEDNNKFELYFETTNIKEAYDSLLVREVKFLHEIIEEPWGQQTMRFFDPDGHLVELGESLETFLSRMHSEGMSVEQVSEKTGVELGFIREIINKA